MGARNWGFLTALPDVIAGTPVQGSMYAYSTALGAFANTSRAWGIVTSGSLAGLTLANTTPAANGVQQYSPALQLAGCGYTGAVSKVCAWRQYVVPVQAATPTATIYYDFSLDGAAYSNVATLTSGGMFTASVLNSTSYSAFGTNFAAYPNLDRGVGYSTADNIYSNNDRPLVISSMARADGANNKVICFSLLHPDALTNGATMRLLSAGISTNGAAATEQFASYCDGSIWSLTGVRLPAYATTALPTAGAVGQVIYCSNGDTGNKCLAMWDGSNWLRIVLGAAVAAV